MSSSILRPTHNQILRFLNEFRNDKKETAYDASVSLNPYPDNPQKSYLFRYCLNNGYIEERERNRFHDFSISYIGEGLIIAGRSPMNRFRLWIEDHPSVWAGMCAIGWYAFPYLHEFLKKAFM